MAGGSGAGAFLHRPAWIWRGELAVALRAARARGVTWGAALVRVFLQGLAACQFGLGRCCFRGWPAALAGVHGGGGAAGCGSRGGGPGQALVVALLIGATRIVNVRRAMRRSNAVGIWVLAPRSDGCGGGRRVLSAGGRHACLGGRPLGYVRTCCPGAGVAAPGLRLWCCGGP